MVGRAQRRREAGCMLPQLAGARVRARAQVHRVSLDQHGRLPFPVRPCHPHRVDDDGPVPRRLPERRPRHARSCRLRLLRQRGGGDLPHHPRRVEEGEVVVTVRNLDALFRPRSIAVVGAGTRPGSVGAVLARNLLSAGFGGPIMPVHPRERAINGVYAYRDVASLPETPDLAVLVTPPPSIPGLVAELGQRGTRAAVIITAGFGEGGNEEGSRLRQATLDAARPHLLRIVGPNCLGVLVPGSGLNASFAHLAPQPGGVAFVTQSGALVTSVLDWAVPRGIGFSHLV